MRYTSKITIEKPRHEVIRQMDNVDNLRHWQAGFVSAEHISGVPGQFGAKMRLSYDFGNRKTVVIETITKQNFPDEFHANYTLKGVRNIQHNYFKTTAQGHTQWICHNDYQATNFKMNSMLFLMPSVFKNQTELYMRNFKKFVEHNHSVCYA